MKHTDALWEVGFIRNKIDTDDRWLFRGILAIYAAQTRDEQMCKETVYQNRRGFNKSDALFMSSLAELIKSGGAFSDTMLITARCRMRKYVGQLTRIANTKQDGKESS